jgi:hypothetical protein
VVVRWERATSDFCLGYIHELREDQMVPYPTCLRKHKKQKNKRKRDESGELGETSIHFIWHERFELSEDVCLSGPLWQSRMLSSIYLKWVDVNLDGPWCGVKTMMGVNPSIIVGVFERTVSSVRSRWTNQHASA